VGTGLRNCFIKAIIFFAKSLARYSYNVKAYPTLAAGRLGNVPKAEERSDEAAMLCCAKDFAP
jgi:hypothetical protein